MNKWGALVAAFIAFTNPMFKTIYIDADSIVAVTPGDGYCMEPLTRLDMGTENYCVVESVELVLKKLKHKEADDE